MKKILCCLFLAFTFTANAQSIELFSAKYHSNTDFTASGKFVVNYTKSSAWVDLWYRYFDGIRHHTNFKTIPVTGLKLNEQKDAIIYQASEIDSEIDTEIETRCADITKKANKLIIRPTGFCRFEQQIKLKSDRSCSSCYYYVVNLVIDQIKI